MKAIRQPFHKRSFRLRWLTIGESAFSWKEIVTFVTIKGVSEPPPNHLGEYGYTMVAWNDPFADMLAREKRHRDMIADIVECG